MFKEIKFNNPSSNIALVKYNSETSELAVRFHRGGDYIYSQVSEAVITDWLLQCNEQGGSVGKYFASNIKNDFEFSKVEG